MIVPNGRGLVPWVAGRSLVLRFRAYVIITSTSTVPCTYSTLYEHYLILSLSCFSMQDPRYKGHACPMHKVMGVEEPWEFFRPCLKYFGKAIKITTYYYDTEKRSKKVIQIHLPIFISICLASACTNKHALPSMENRLLLVGFA